TSDPALTPVAAPLDRPGQARRRPWRDGHNPATPTIQPINTVTAITSHPSWSPRPRREPGPPRPTTPASAPEPASASNAGKPGPDRTDASRRTRAQLSSGYVSDKFGRQSPASAGTRPDLQLTAVHVLIRRGLAARLDPRGVPVLRGWEQRHSRPRGRGLLNDVPQAIVAAVPVDDHQVLHTRGPQRLVDVLHDRHQRAGADAHRPGEPGMLVRARDLRCFRPKRYDWGVTG